MDSIKKKRIRHMVKRLIIIIPEWTVSLHQKWMKNYIKSDKVLKILQNNCSHHFNQVLNK